METEITAANGKKKSALSVFGHSLSFFHDHAVNELRQIFPDLGLESIRWVLTVPAIWSATAK